MCKKTNDSMREWIWAAMPLEYRDFKLFHAAFTRKNNTTGSACQSFTFQFYGNMNRYVWSIDNKTVSKRIKF